VNALNHEFSALGKRLAAVSGALVALTSLLVDAPVWVASARGGVTTLSILLVVKVASGYLARAGRGA